MSLRHTPIHNLHLDLNGRMVPFGEWELPVQFQSVLSEVQAVRSKAGLFDVSHMGRIKIDGPDARKMLDWIHTADLPEDMEVGQARYGLLCNQEGGIIDDCIVYRLDQSEFLLVANAANTLEVIDWLKHWHHQNFPNLSLEDQTEGISMLALQGPLALRIVRSVIGADIETLRRYRAIMASVHGRSMLIARTGYTGEEGVELMPTAQDAPWLWELLVNQGAIPCGLGARDTLRLEAGLLLHGHEMNPSVSPIAAGLERFLSKREFYGSEAIRHIEKQGPMQRLVGLLSPPRSPMPRAGTTILADKHAVGQITSGSFSPTLDRNISLGYLPVRFTSPGTELQFDIRGKLVEAKVVSLPFYTRPNISPTRLDSHGHS